MFYTQHSLPDVSYYVTASKTEICNVSLNWEKLLFFVENQKIRYLSKDTLILIDENFNLDKETIPWAPRPIHENRIFILDPPELVQLSNIGDVKILDRLVQMTDVPNKAWAAHILIAKMLGFSDVKSIPEVWWKTEGRTGIAKQNWKKYVGQIKPTLRWDSQKKYFTYKDPKGIQRM